MATFNTLHATPRVAPVHTQTQGNDLCSWVAHVPTLDQPPQLVELFPHLCSGVNIITILGNKLQLVEQERPYRHPWLLLEHHQG